jgi:alginate O-acetyltransferase complex protein AlgI
MSFVSLAFLFFFITVLIVYRLVPARSGAWPIAVGSLAFYSWWDLRHLGLLIGLSVSVYVLALAMDRITGRARRTLFLVGVAGVVGCLLAARAGAFSHGELGAVFGGPPPSRVHSWDPLVALGLSFYSLRLISYLIEVYRAKWKAETHLARFIAYVSFFLELPAGPIERPQDFMPQLSARAGFDYCGVTSGLKLVTWGVFKKVVVADRLAIIVNTVYGFPSEYGGFSLLIATVFFSFQIYCDFSAYSDIAIGAGQVMGFRLRQNFDLPYLSSSIPEFWNRWHMSLSSWLRDYVFLPSAFAASRWVERLRLSARSMDLVSYSSAAMMTLLVAGLWHGVAWTFVLWGTAIGLFIVLSRTTARFRRNHAVSVWLKGWPGLQRFARVTTTFALINFAWVFFRAESVPQAMQVLGGTLGGWHDLLQPGGLAHEIRKLGVSGGEFSLACAFTSLVLIADVAAYQYGHGVVTLVSSMRPAMRWAVYYAVVLLIFMFGMFSKSPFIYFQF